MTAYLNAFPEHWEWPAELPAGDGTVATLSLGQKEVLAIGSTALVHRVCLGCRDRQLKSKTQVNGVNRAICRRPSLV